ncbi:MAG: hypothetical protein QXP81_06325 [Nitrososphaerota archaeon]
MELLIKEMVEKAGEIGFPVEDSVSDAALTLKGYGTEALYATSTAFLMGASCLSQRAAGIAIRSIEPGKGVRNGRSVVELWLKRGDRALGSIGAPWMPFIFADEMMDRTLWMYLVTVSRRYTRELVGDVSLLLEMDELQAILPHLLAFAAGAPTLEERDRLLSAAKPTDSGSPRELLENLEELVEIAGQLGQASQLRLRSMLEGTDLDEDQREAALEIWHEALAVGGGLTMPLMLSVDVLKRAVTTSLRHHGVSISEAELGELDRELLMVSEALPAAVLIAAALYADAFTLRCELGVSQNPHLSIYAMLLHGMDALEGIEGDPGEGPCAKMISYWVDEAREFTPYHVGVIHALLTDLHKRCYRTVYVKLEEPRRRKRKRR